MGSALSMFLLLLQISKQTAAPIPALLFNKFIPQKPTPFLPFLGIVNSLAGVIPSVGNPLSPGSTPGISHAGQASGTLPGQTTTPGVSTPVSSLPIFPIPGITVPLFPGLSGILSGQPSAPAPGPVSTPPGSTGSIAGSTPVSTPGSTLGSTPGTTSGSTPGTPPLPTGATIPGIIPAITAPLLPGISAIISSLQTPIVPATPSNGTTSLVTDQLKSQLDAAKVAYIQNGLAYGFALAQQVLTGFVHGLLTPLSVTASNIQNG